MPQELQVLRCYNCQTFQVHIVKKSNKWECKMCGEKQSLKKVYARGNGRDCRLHVQRLNEMYIKEQEEKQIEYGSLVSEHFESTEVQPDMNGTHSSSPNMSKWNQYLEAAESEETANLPSPVSEIQNDTSKVEYEMLENERSNELIPNSYKGDEDDNFTNFVAYSHNDYPSSMLPKNISSQRHKTSNRMNHPQLERELKIDRNSRWSQFCDKSSASYLQKDDDDDDDSEHVNQRKNQVTDSFKNHSQLLEKELRLKKYGIQGTNYDGTSIENYDSQNNRQRNNQVTADLENNSQLESELRLKKQGMQGTSYGSSMGNYDSQLENELRLKKYGIQGTSYDGSSMKNYDSQIIGQKNNQVTDGFENNSDFANELKLNKHGIQGIDYNGSSMSFFQNSCSLIYEQTSGQMTDINNDFQDYSELENELKLDRDSIQRKDNIENSNPNNTHLVQISHRKRQIADTDDCFQSTFSCNREGRNTKTNASLPKFAKNDYNEDELDDLLSF